MPDNEMTTGEGTVWINCSFLNISENANFLRSLCIVQVPSFYIMLAVVVTSTAELKGDMRRRLKYIYSI